MTCARNVRLLVLAWALGIAPFADAADRFVSRLGADNDNDCLTATTPCRTMRWASLQAASGDTINVATGKYKDRLLIYTTQTLTLSGGWSLDFSTRDSGAMPTQFVPVRDGLLGTLTQIDITGWDATLQDIDVTIDGIVFKRGRSAGEPAVHVTGYASDVIRVAFVDCVFEKNRTGGVGVSAYGGAAIDVEMTGCRFQRTKGVDPSVSLYAEGDSAVTASIVNSLFAGPKGRAIAFRTYGSGAPWPILTLGIASTTITANELGGIVGSAAADGIVGVTLSNVVTWGNCRAASCAANPTGLDLQASIEAGGSASLAVNADHVDVHHVAVTGGAMLDDLGGNVDLVPGFVPHDRAYHLAADSPLIDAGTNAGIPTVDLDGDARPVDGDGDGLAVADIGADEFVP